jgi:hypothetical protein
MKAFEIADKMGTSDKLLNPRRRIGKKIRERKSGYSLQVEIRRY